MTRVTHSWVLARSPTRVLSGASCPGVVGRLLRICNYECLVISQQDFGGVDCGPVEVGGTQAKLAGEGFCTAYGELPPPRPAALTQIRRKLRACRKMSPFIRDKPGLPAVGCRCHGVQGQLLVCYLGKPTDPAQVWTEPSPLRKQD